MSWKHTEWVACAFRDVCFQGSRVVQLCLLASARAMRHRSILALSTFLSLFLSLSLFRLSSLVTPRPFFFL